MQYRNIIRYLPDHTPAFVMFQVAANRKIPIHGLKAVIWAGNRGKNAEST
jgi:hypothetical protein